MLAYSMQYANSENPRAACRPVSFHRPDFNIQRRRKTGPSPYAFQFSIFPAYRLFTLCPGYFSRWLSRSHLCTCIFGPALLRTLRATRTAVFRPEWIVLFCRVRCMRKYGSFHIIFAADSTIPSDLLHAAAYIIFSAREAFKYKIGSLFQQRTAQYLRFVCLLRAITNFTLNSAKNNQRTVKSCSNI